MTILTKASNSVPQDTNKEIHFVRHVIKICLKGVLSVSRFLVKHYEGRL